MLNIILSLFLAATPSDFRLSVIKALPTWEADKLAQFEQPELAAVRSDIQDDASDEQLRADWNALEALDQALNNRKVV